MAAGRESRLPTWADAAIVVVIALLARGIEALTDPTLFNDGPRFLAMAQAFLAGDWRSALGDAFHPLTSLAMAALSRGLGIGLESAGELVSILSGGVAAFAIWRLALDQLGRRVALVAGLIFALHPRLRESSAGVQSDGLHLACFALAALFAWRTLERRQLGWAALAGLCTGLGYLTRPEGLAVSVVLAGWLAADLAQRRLAFGRALALGGVYAATLAVVAGPYVLALHELGGGWSITRKKDLTTWAQPGSPTPEAAAPEAPAAPSTPPAPAPTPAPVTSRTDPSAPPTAASTFGGEVLRDGIRGFHPILLLLSLLGVYAIARGEPEGRRAAAFALSYFLLFAALLVLLHSTAGYVSRRHFLAAAALLAPLAGRGALALGDTLQSVPRIARGHLVPALGSAIVLGIFVEMLLPKGEPSKLAREDAAHWLREHHAPSVVAAHRARDAYYAGATTHVAFIEAGEGMDAMLRNAHAQGAQYAILDLSLGSGLAVPVWAHVLHREKYPGAEVLVLDLGR